MKQLKRLSLFIAVLLTFGINLAFGSNVFITNMDLTSKINLKGNIETRGLVDNPLTAGINIRVSSFSSIMTRILKTPMQKPYLLTVPRLLSWTYSMFWT